MEKLKIGLVGVGGQGGGHVTGLTDLVKRELDVLSATNGNDALQMLKEHPKVEVVILDVKMPGMDGIETLKEIKKAHPLTEVIMLTGHASVESAIDGMKQGAFDYLMKPCDLDQLIKLVKEAASKKQLQEAKILEARMKEITSRHA